MSEKSTERALEQLKIEEYKLKIKMAKRENIFMTVFKIIFLVFVVILGVLLIRSVEDRQNQRAADRQLQAEARQAQREAQEASITEHRYIFTLFVDSLGNDGILPFEMWQLNNGLELTAYGIALLSSFLREHAPDATLNQMLEFIENKTIDITRYI